MGFTQRQANGKFTSDEADGFIASLQEAEFAGNEAPAPSQPAPRLSATDRTLRDIPSERLAAELQRRGWIVAEP